MMITFLPSNTSPRLLLRLRIRTWKDDDDDVMVKVGGKNQDMEIKAHFNVLMLYMFAKISKLKEVKGNISSIVINEGKSSSLWISFNLLFHSSFTSPHSLTPINNEFAINNFD